MAEIPGRYRVPRPDDAVLGTGKLQDSKTSEPCDIRLTGTKEQLDAVVEALGRTFELLTVSKDYLNRGSTTEFRRYIKAKLK